MANSWFYADHRNQQCGPVDTEWMSIAVRSGKLHAATLVWHEGLATWVPLTQVLGELGLPAAFSPTAAAPMPAVPHASVQVRTASGQIAVAKPTSSSGWVLPLVIILGGFVVIGGILAAVAIPAYQEYLIKAKVSQAWVVATSQRTRVNEFYAAQNRCPSNSDNGFPDAGNYAPIAFADIQIHPLDGGVCAIDAVFDDDQPSPIRGKQIQLRRSARGKWTHSSDVDSKYLPVSMRQAHDTQ